MSSRGGLRQVHGVHLNGVYSACCRVCPTSIVYISLCIPMRTRRYICHVRYQTNEGLAAEYENVDFEVVCGVA